MDFEPGIGNGGISCTGCGCLVTLMSGLVLLFILVLPWATSYAIQPVDVGRPYLGYLSSLCCCVGSLGILGGLVLILIDEGPPTNQAGAAPNPKNRPRPKPPKRG